MPDGPGTRPEIGLARSRAASAAIRSHEAPGAACAHADARAHAASKSPGIESIVLRYHGSRPLAKYVESSVTLRTSRGKRAANTCAKNEP